MTEPAPKPAKAPTPKRKPPANKRAVARLAAVQALYQMEVTGAGARDIVKEFELFRLRQDIDGETLRAIDLNWFDGLVSGVVNHQRSVDAAIDEALKEGWPLARIDLTLRALLRAGVVELMFREEVPVRVVISEYVEVAKAFFSEDEPRMTNGVLDRIAHRVRAAELAAPPRAAAPVAGGEPSA
ncbi:transcription antitermination factor NusB [Acuticoccus sp. MNP-M23]|uniref:transcription antitermination factor NusB n=1 Tax=Acuticoccus sp. MNP-M23 TaxID=3072793 RepID=UPI002815B00F|nr:transcription antitermination factor NusB [Acuticoccus sp. MNP-M23]WMS43351.1 transcription antitermination factor NusB [Acuticoccus sp. MNP-M23]